MNPMIETHRASVVRDLARYLDDLKTWTGYVAHGLVKPEDAKSQIQFAVDRVKADQFLLDVIDGVFV